MRCSNPKKLFSRAAGERYLTHSRALFPIEDGAG